MANAGWLVAPYFSMLVICRWRPFGHCLCGRTALMLPVGWVAVVLLLAGVIGVWSPPLAVMALCGALSGFAMIAGGGGGDDDSGPSDEDEPPPPATDWDAFDGLRQRWDGERRGDRFGRRPRAYR